MAQTLVTNDTVEDLKEVVLELLQKNMSVHMMVCTEVSQRFPNYKDLNRETQDEITCLVQLRVYKEILGGIV